MRIGLLKTSIGDFGNKGFYNAQEIGLAKELEKLFDEVIIYKPVSVCEEKLIVPLEGYGHTVLHQIPCKQQGTNALWDCSVMDSSIDALVYFSDTQLIVPNVYKWCVAHDIPMYPYIGVIESHSTSKLKSMIINMLFYRNVLVYRKCTCFAKTPEVKRGLKAKGIEKSVVVPVGLDTSLLKQGVENVPVELLKEKWGYGTDDKVLLFIGRMTDEKQPLRMVNIFSELYAKDNSYRLFMVGKGELLDEVKALVDKIGLTDVVRFENQIPNSDIWELYRISDAFINLNQQEIFGMAILEAMYYGCKVVAWTAPGPNFIIENGESGFLCCSNEEVVGAVIEQTIDAEVSRRRVLDTFTWQASAKIIADNVMSGEDSCE